MILTQETQAEWIRRLRSGDYAQGDGHLVALRAVRIDGQVQVVAQYCCLGVYGCILPEITWEAGEGHERRSHFETYTINPTAKADGKVFRNRQEKTQPTSFLPNHILPASIQEELADKNDCGWSFDRIADVLEKADMASATNRLDAEERLKQAFAAAADPDGSPT